MVVGTAYSQREEKKETKSSNNFRLAIYLEHLLQFLRPPKKSGWTQFRVSWNYIWLTHLVEFQILTIPQDVHVMLPSVMPK